MGTVHITSTANPLQTSIEYLAKVMELVNDNVAFNWRRLTCRPGTCEEWRSVDQSNSGPMGYWV